MGTKIIICLDGTGPEYIQKSETPNLDAISEAGFSTIGRAIVPTATNVNNTTIVTAGFPEEHGITTNYYYDPATRTEVYMESSEFILKETMFRRLARQGKKVALFTAKDKLKTLIQDGATIAESAEKPSPWIVDSVGPPSDIYTIEVNHWLFRAARAVLQAEAPDLLYITTTDYVTHIYSPDDERAQWNIKEIDRLLGEILNCALADVELVVTADHGMNAKTYGLDLNKILADAGIVANAIPIIKDRHVVHHKNLGGAAYIYLDHPETREDTMALLSEEKGIETVMTSSDAARQYRLHPARIGHIFVLAGKGTVFGALPAAREAVQVRSHGSLYEQQIPIYAIGAGPLSIRPESNHEVSSWVFDHGQKS
jgi:phosphonoacetate hydrolase